MNKLGTIEFIRTSKESGIELTAYGNYDEKAIQIVIDVLRGGLERGAYSDAPATEEKQSTG